MTSPLVSCLCVTRNRSAFMPWLLWGFERQTWTNRELVIVDGSSTPCPGFRRDDVRVIQAEENENVPAMRNRALSAARGSAVAWFDDDDWQHPLRIEWLVERLSDGAPMAGPSSAFILDLFADQAWQYRGAEGALLFNGAGFWTEFARRARFDERRRRASDTLWLAELTKASGQKTALQPTDPTFFWLYHGKNLSLSPRRGRLRGMLGAADRTKLFQAIGGDAWTDTDEQLGALRARVTNTARALEGQP